MYCGSPSKKEIDVTSLKMSNSKNLNSYLITDHTTKDINSFTKFDISLNKSFDKPKSESNYIKAMWNPNFNIF